jgi:predicted ester cyclase
MIRRFVEEAFTKKNLEIFDTLVAPDLRINGREIGRDGFRQSVADLYRVWGDLRTEIRLMVAEGDLVATYLVGSGTQVGVFAGIQPTGRRVQWEGMTISRIRDGKIQERWSVFDWDQVFRQLHAPADRSN